MVWLARLFIVLILGAVTLQDLKSRSVYWFWFPLLVLLFITDLTFSHHQSLMETGQTALLNTGFLFLQLLLVSVYFSIKNKQWINITSELLGWGDILLLFSIACYFSILNYIFFYVFSLIIVVCIFIAGLLLKKKYEQIPLAGLQAIILIVCLAVSWRYPKMDLASDDWIQHFIYK